MNCPACSAFNESVARRCTICETPLHQEQPEREEAHEDDGLASTQLLLPLLVCTLVQCGTYIQGSIFTLVPEVKTEGYPFTISMSLSVLSAGARFLGWGFLLFWVHQTIGDLRAILPARRIGTTPWGAVLGFFIPILNLFHAYRVLGLLGEASDAEQLSYEEEIPVERAGYRDLPTQRIELPPPPRVALGAWTVFGLMNPLLVVISSTTAENFWFSFTINKLLWLNNLIVTVLTVQIFFALDARVCELHRRARSLETGQRIAPWKDERPIAAYSVASMVALAAVMSILLMLQPAETPFSFSRFFVAVLVLTPVLGLALRGWESSLRRRWPGAVAVWGLLLIPGIAVLISRK